MLIIHRLRRIRCECSLRGHTFLLRRKLRQTKIQYFRVPSLSYKNVSRFDVPVNDSFAVRGLQTLCNLDRQIEQTFDFHWPAGDAVL